MHATLCRRRKAAHTTGEKTRRSAKAKGFEIRGIMIQGLAPQLLGYPAGPALTASSTPQIFGGLLLGAGQCTRHDTHTREQVGKVSAAGQMPHLSPICPSPLGAGQSMWRGAEGMCPHLILQSLSPTEKDGCSRGHGHKVLVPPLSPVPE